LSNKQHSSDRRENRESAQKKFNNACAGARLTASEKQAFSKYFHKMDKYKREYMSYGEIKRLASEWARSAQNPYK